MTLTVPYITAWTGERQLPGRVIPAAGGHGIRYIDETFVDRDRHGVLWARAESRPGIGNPRFGDIHPLRQRRAMRKLLCQVCAGPPDRSHQGVLWIMPDHRDDWPNWPEHMATNDAPVCLSCARIAAKHCPHLRHRHVLVRSTHHPVAGIRGALYHYATGNARQAKDATVAYGDPRIRWVQAHQLIRELRECTLVGEIDRVS